MLRHRILQYTDKEMNVSREPSTSVQRVQQALQSFDLPLVVVEVPASTRTVPEAARALGCSEGQIVKSLVFRGERTGEAILVVASGSNRVKEERLAALVGEPVVLADAAFVRSRTGFAIGGVPPLAHSEPLETFIDADLMQYDEVWAAAGTPHHVFRLTPRELVQVVSDGQVVLIH